MPRLSTDPYRGLGLTKRMPKADPVLGRDVTWTEDGSEHAGQVWSLCPDDGRFWEIATHRAGRLYWIATFGGRELRAASFDPATDTFTVGYWIWSSSGTCLRDGKAVA